MTDRDRWGLSMLELLTSIGSLKAMNGKGAKLTFEPVNGESQPSAVWKALLIQTRDKILQTRQELAAKKMAKKNNSILHSEVNEVKIVNKSYLTRSFRASNVADRTMLNNIAHEFTLNEEQDRAFRIVANHAVENNDDQLLMYLGGMAGTGKSQVIKSLIELFKNRGEEYRFQCLAPTGTAAALIGGSTYHSVLGISQFSADRTDSTAKKAQIYDRLHSIDYIFINEVSMIDCVSLNDISVKMCNSTGIYDKPFGGKHVILAGDFAQLPPTKGLSLYHHKVTSVLHKTNSVNDQIQTMGKMIWHMFTTVVILRQNMRQKSQSENDKKFRTLLENLRYRACTEEDIELLRSRITTKKRSDTWINLPQFRNVSVIVSRNCERDVINEKKAETFANDTNQELHTFYSVDSYPSATSQREQKNSKHVEKKIKNNVRMSNKMSVEMQERLWRIKPEFTKNMPSKLTVCLGMPVMVKFNIATECGVTNGAEGIVVGWKDRDIGEGKKALVTLFIKLTALPTPVQLPGLPENVVPITSGTQSVGCTMPNDTIKHINRSQVYVLPNFAMTDYNSQGRTQPFNVVDLHNCRNHQSVYTCLSRGSTYDGTLIIQGFSTDHMQGNLSSDLRQEFRHLEMLDEITKLKFLETLSDEVYGESRIPLLHSYRAHVGTNHVPSKTHESLKWSQTDQLVIPDIPDEDMYGFEYLDPNDKKWKEKQNDKTQSSMKKTSAAKNRNKTDTSKYVPAKGSQPLDNINTVKNTTTQIHQSMTKLKRKHATDDGTVTKAKRVRGDEAEIDAPSEVVPVGFKWQNYSCAYDSLFTILYYIYSAAPDTWITDISIQNSHLNVFGNLCKQIDNGDINMEMARSILRQRLNDLNSNLFSTTSNGTSIDELCTEFLQSEHSTLTMDRTCRRCMFSMPVETSDKILWDCDASKWKGYPINLGNYRNRTIQEWLKVLCYHKISRKCDMCQKYMYRVTRFLTNLPVFLCFNVCVIPVHVSTDLYVGGHRYVLRGLIYLGSNHFVVRIVDVQGRIWFNDGMQNGRICVEEGNIINVDPTMLQKARGKTLSCVLYMKI